MATTSFALNFILQVRKSHTVIFIYIYGKLFRKQEKKGRSLKEISLATRKEFLTMYEENELIGDVKSGRGKINCYYMCKCQSALEDENGKHPIDGEFNFILAIDDDLEIGCYKRTIMQELGRLEDEELIRSIAKVVCQNKLSTDAAITYIRQFRTKQRPDSDNVKLAQSIGKAIDEYKSKHSYVDDEMIQASLNLLLSGLPENISGNMENIDNL